MNQATPNDPLLERWRQARRELELARDRLADARAKVAAVEQRMAECEKALAGGGG